VAHNEDIYILNETYNSHRTAVIHKL